MDIHKDVADDTTKILVSNQRRQPVAVVLCAKTQFSDLIVRNTRRAAQAKEILGPNLGRVVLEPLHTGSTDCYQYAVMPFCHQLSKTPIMRYLLRYHLMPTVLQWLRDVARHTCDSSLPLSAQNPFEQCLVHLLDRTTLPDDVHQLATQSLDRLAKDQWRPAHVLMHTDLWAGNILIGPPTLPGFANLSWRQRMVIIDWPGAETMGYAMYDLIRFGMSYRIPKWLLRREIKAHCQILQCDIKDAIGYLLCAVGHIGQHQKEFPESRYVATTRNCIDRLQACLT